MRVLIDSTRSLFGRALAQHIQEISRSPDGTTECSLISLESVAECEWPALLLTAEAVILDLRENVSNSLHVMQLLRNKTQVASNGCEVKGDVDDCSALPVPTRVIGISSIMTWNKVSMETMCRPSSPDSTQSAAVAKLSEQDYKQRKSSRRYLRLVQLENELLALDSPQLKAHVVACGVMYGRGEQSFGNWFESAWRHSAVKQQPLMFIGSGDNTIPTIHVDDAACAVASLVVAASQPLQQTEEAPPYMVATDKSRSQQKDLVAAISSALGNGEISSISLVRFVRLSHLFAASARTVCCFGIALLTMELRSELLLQLRWVSVMGLICFISISERRQSYAE